MRAKFVTLSEVQVASLRSCFEEEVGSAPLLEQPTEGDLLGMLAPLDNAKLLRNRMRLWQDKELYAVPEGESDQ